VKVPPGQARDQRQRHIDQGRTVNSAAGFSHESLELGERRVRNPAAIAEAVHDLIFCQRQQPRQLRQYRQIIRAGSLGEEGGVVGGQRKVLMHSSSFVNASSATLVHKSAWSGDHGPGVFVLSDRLFLISGSYVSVEDEDALVIAAVVAAGVGDVGEADAAESADGEVATGRACADVLTGSSRCE
jgi:hypothetical protein